MSAEYEPFKPTAAGSPADEAEALRLEVSHVQASGVLGEARLRRMFDYLAERSLAGQSPKEIAIAIDVFGKGADFDVGNDALVRVYIHKLRKALDEFYSSESAEDAQTIHIPRCEYRLRLSPKALPATEAVDSQGEVKQAKIRRPTIIAAAIAILLAATLALIWSSRPHSDLDRVR